MENKMPDKIADERIASAAKTLFTYCRVRTRSREEAEDLSQDILLALLRTRENLRDDKAFYGFMWAVAGNVYKDWCKKRARTAEVALAEQLPDRAVPIAELLEKEADIQALYRTLGLLTAQYRRVTVLYYFDGVKVSEIARRLKLSESMVKFLLFQSRKLLKEGMNMERTTSHLRFNPGSMHLRFWGAGENPFWKLCEDNLIAQNILFACYNDRCTAEEISLKIGVAVPYLEKDLQALCTHKMLVHKGGRYETDVVIFTKEFADEADKVTLPLQGKIAQILADFLRVHLAAVEAIGFAQGTADKNLLRWHIATLLLEKAVFGKYQGSLAVAFPTKYNGEEAFVWGEEDYPSRYGSFGTCGLRNANGDLIRFLDFSLNGEMDHKYFFGYPGRVNLALAIAGGSTQDFGENDRLEISEFIKRGLVQKDGGTLQLTCPVYTAAEFARLLSLADNAMDEIAQATQEMMRTSTDILVQHTPVAMKKQAESMGWLSMFDEAICAPVKILCDSGVLRPVTESEHPTTYVVLQ